MAKLYQMIVAVAGVDLMHWESGVRQGSVGHRLASAGERPGLSTIVAYEVAFLSPLILRLQSLLFCEPGHLRPAWGIRSWEPVMQWLPG